MNYFLWTNGKEHGPYTLEQIQRAIDSGKINPQQTARTGDSTDWQPLHQIADLKFTPQKPPPPAPRKIPPVSNQSDFKGSTLAVFFQVFAILDFLAAAFGILACIVGNSNERSVGVIAIVSGIGGGFMLLAFFKVIECLHEMVFRLRNIERALNQTNQ